jgi:ATP-binding cassette subfamily B protein AbcA/BmrA
MTKKSINTELFRKIVLFLGVKVFWLFCIGIFVGVFVYAIEVAFAYSLQAFLTAIGVMQQAIVRLPWWVPESGLFEVLVFFFVVGSLRSFLQWAQLYLQGVTAEELRFLQRGRLLRWAFHSESVSSSQVITLLNDRTNSAAAFVQSLQILFVQLTCGLLLGASLFYMEPLLTLVTAAILGLLLLPMRVFDRKIRVSGVGLNNEGAKINQQLLAAIKNLLLMQIYGTQNREEKKAQDRSVSIRSYHLIYYSFNALKFALPQFVGLILICMITVVAKTQIDMPPGKLISYFYLFVRFLQTISSSAQAMSPIIQHWPQVSDLAKWWASHSFDGIRNQRELKEGIEPKPLEQSPGWTFSNVEFSYPNAKNKLLQNVNFQISPGECFVVTGPSGVGKSTLLSLLLGLHQPNGGKIAVSIGGNNYPLLELKERILHSVGYVGAESFLIEGTILENLCYGLQTIPAESLLLDICRKAECGFVFELGLQHYLTEQGQGLSAGQKQRLSLARALLRNPRILILDEATANLDAETESNLVNTLSQLKGQVTMVVVTHRQAFLKIADQELRLGGGLA